MQQMQCAWIENCIGHYDNTGKRVTEIAHVQYSRVCCNGVANLNIFAQATRNNMKTKIIGLTYRRQPSSPYKFSSKFKINYDHEHLTVKAELPSPFIKEVM